MDSGAAAAPLLFHTDVNKAVGEIHVHPGTQLRCIAADDTLATLCALAAKGLSRPLVFVSSDIAPVREWAAAAEDASVIWVESHHGTHGRSRSVGGAVSLRLFSNGDQLIARQDVVLQLLRFIAQRKNTTVTAVLLTDLQSPPAFEVAPGVLTIAPFKDVLHHMVQQLPHDDGGGSADAARVAHVTHWLERVPRTEHEPAPLLRRDGALALSIGPHCEFEAVADLRAATTTLSAAARGLYVGYPLECLVPSDSETARRMIATTTRQEVPAAFDPQHYPKGVNANFCAGDIATLEEKYGGVHGIFHDPEKREIAKVLPVLVRATLAVANPALLQANGLTVLELGCGTGLLSEELLRARDDLRLIATEVSFGFAALTRQRLSQHPEHARRYDIVLHGASELTAVASGTAELAFVCDVYHHLEYPRTMMREVHRVLKPGGRLVLIDFHRDVDRHYSHPEDPLWVMKHLRADQATFEEEIMSTGFSKSTREVHVEGLTENYTIVFDRS
jgi:SAM-dependent methyltransferase